MSADKIQCYECKDWFSNITSHIKIHNLSIKEYLARYPKAPTMSQEYRDKHKQNALNRYGGENAELWKKKANSNRAFNFIENRDLKLLMQRDYRSAKVCLKNKLWKPSIILYGSVIEAILVEATNKKTFDESLNTALEKKIISEKEYHKIYLVKDFRNFVHIHKELTGKEEITEYWAKTFGDICESIIKYFQK